MTDREGVHLKQREEYVQRPEIGRVVGTLKEQGKNRKQKPALLEHKMEQNDFKQNNNKHNNNNDKFAFQVLSGCHTKINK